MNMKVKSDGFIDNAWNGYNLSSLD